MHIFVAIDAKWISNDKSKVFWEEFFRAIIEELIRRNQTKWSEESKFINLKKILNISEMEIEKFGKEKLEMIEVLKIKKKNLEEEELKKQKFQMEKIEDKNEDNELKKKEEEKINEELKKEKEKEEEIKNIDVSYLKNIDIEDLRKEFIYQTKSISSEFSDLKYLITGKKEKIEFSDLKLETNIQFLCFYIQIKLQHSSSNRKRAFINKKYVDCQDNKKAEYYLKKLTRKVIEEESNRIFRWRLKLINIEKKKSIF